MATEMLTWARRQVFKQFDLSSSERFVLMLLADNASWDEEDGQWHARPFQETLAAESGLSKRSVMRALNRLTEQGLISSYRRRRKSGFLGGNGYIFHPEAVEQPITLTEQNRVIPGGDTVSPAPADWHDSKRRHCVTSVEDSLRRRHSVTSEVTPATPPAREVDARASLNRQVEPSSSSSSSVADEFSAGAGFRPAAGAAGDDDDDQWPSAEEEHRPDASAAGPAADSAVSTTEAVSVSVAEVSAQVEGPAGDMSGQVAAGADSGADSGPVKVSAVGSGGVHRGVDVAVVANQASAAIGRRASTADIRWLIDQVLDRAKARVQRPTSYVVAAVTVDPAGWASQLSSIPAAASVELAGQDTSGQRTGQVAGQMVGQMSAGHRAGCPVDDHASFGHRQGRCRMCRSEAMAGGWRAEYDSGRMARSKFEKLSAEAQQAVGKQEIEISG